LSPSMREVPRRGGGSVLSLKRHSPSLPLRAASPLKEGAKAAFQPLPFKADNHNFRKGIAKGYYTLFLPKRKEDFRVFEKGDTEIFSKNIHFSEKFPQNPDRSPNKNAKSIRLFGMIREFAHVCFCGHMTLKHDFMTSFQAQSVISYQLCKIFVIFTLFCSENYGKTTKVCIFTSIFERFVN